MPDLLWHPASASPWVEMRLSPRGRAVAGPRIKSGGDEKAGLHPVSQDMDFPAEAPPHDVSLRIGDVDRQPVAMMQHLVDRMSAVATVAGAGEPGRIGDSRPGRPRRSRRRARQRARRCALAGQVVERGLERCEAAAQLCCADGIIGRGLLARGLIWRSGCIEIETDARDRLRATPALRAKSVSADRTGRRPERALSPAPPEAGVLFIFWVWRARARSSGCTGRPLRKMPVREVGAGSADLAIRARSAGVSVTTRSRAAMTISRLIAASAGLRMLSTGGMNVARQRGGRLQRIEPGPWRTGLRRSAGAMSDCARWRGSSPWGVSGCRKNIANRMGHG